jgi:hypothetical protein
MKLNPAQRIVVVVGLAFAMWELGHWVTTRGGRFGWVAYAPLSRTTFAPTPPGALHPWVQLLVWLALVAVWVVASLFVLRRPTE